MSLRSVRPHRGLAWGLLGLALVSGCARAAPEPEHASSAAPHESPSGEAKPEDETAPEPRPDPSTPAPLAAATRLTDRAENVLEAYRKGEDPQAAAGPWVVKGQESELRTDVQTAIERLGVKNFVVRGVGVKVGLPKSGKAGKEDAGSRSAKWLTLVVLTAGDRPTVAAAKKKRILEGLMPVEKLPERAPDLKSLGKGLGRAIQDANECTSFPIAEASALEAHFPAGRGLERALQANEATPERLREFCDAVAHTSESRVPLVGPDDFIAFGLDADGQVVGYVDELRLQVTKSGTVALHWLGFDRLPGAGSSKKAAP